MQPGDGIAVRTDKGPLAEVVAYETSEVAQTGAGAILCANSGRQYIDFTCGIAVNTLGHNHPAAVRAIVEQSSRVTHVADVMRHIPQLRLADRIRQLLAQAVPGSDWSILFLNGGSESVDAAAKLAMKVTGRSRFLAFEGAFHGRTVFATALSHSKRRHWDAYEPFLMSLRANVVHSPAPLCGSCPASEQVPTDCCADGALRILGDIGEKVAAVFFEPMQGEGGYRPFSRRGAERIQRSARSCGALLVVDEVQTGFGRTGRWFGFEHLEIEPDIVVFGKAIGGGLPLSGVAARRELMERWEPGEHGTTFGGNPVACAAGLAVLQTIEDEGLVLQASTLGTVIRDRLSALVGKHGIVDVRGLGLMVGIELRAPDGSPDYARCEAVKHAAADMGLLVMTCGTRIGSSIADNSAIRLIPPLNVSMETLDHGLDILIQALTSVSPAATGPGRALSC
ncbi:MAG: aspartate aminotransferase family protein [Capsulimonadaceae bacterium]